MKDPVLGDYYLLFTHLPIAGELYSELPITLAPGVLLASTPYHAVERGASAGSKLELHVGLGAWVYPGHGIGMRVCHACIMVDASVSAEKALHYAWVMAAALYLTKPLYINIGGFFQYGTPYDGLLGHRPHRIDQGLNVCLDTFFTHANDQSLLQFDEHDLKRAGRYFPLILKILDEESRFQRPYTNLRSFFKAVLWERLRFADSIFSELFSTIDSFTGNPTHKHRNKISANLSLFLDGIPSLITGSATTAQTYVTRLQAIWDRHRSSCKHGYKKNIPSPVVQPQSIPKPSDSVEMKDLFDLMEIARVSIIKMLLLEEAAFRDYCLIPVPTYEDDKDITEATRNTDAGDFFAKNYPIPKEDVFLYTDLSDALIPPTKSEGRSCSSVICT
jgi:hypothetical protein